MRKLRKLKVRNCKRTKKDAMLVIRKSVTLELNANAALFSAIVIGFRNLTTAIIIIAQRDRKSLRKQ